MFADPLAGSQININGKEYVFLEAPGAPGIVYAEIGRRAKVYRLRQTQDGRYYAFKVFRPRYRGPATVENTARIAALKGVPGLAVVERTVVTPETHSALVAQQSHYAYSILMPWIEGHIWFNHVGRRTPLTAQQSLSLARLLADVMASLESRGLAHCDLSSSNFLFSPDYRRLELIDIEEMFGAGMEQPLELPAGTSGYAPDWAKQHGLWEAGADRFSTGILLSEILCWQFEDICAASDGDAYFADGEFGHKTKRFRLMSERLESMHLLLARLFQSVWYAQSVEECPRIADWQQVLAQVSEPAAAPIATAVRLAAAANLPAPNPAQEQPVPPHPSASRETSPAAGNKIPAWIWAVGGIVFLGLCLFTLAVGGVIGGVALTQNQSATQPGVLQIQSTPVQYQSLAVTMPPQPTDTERPRPTATNPSTPTATQYSRPVNTKRPDPTATKLPTQVRCPGALPSQLQMDMKAYVCTKRDRVITFPKPLMSRDNEVFRMYPGTELKIVGGPVCGEGATWWQIRVLRGTLVRYGQDYTLTEDATVWVQEGGDETDPFWICPR